LDLMIIYAREGDRDMVLETLEIGAVISDEITANCFELRDIAKYDADNAADKDAEAVKKARNAVEKAEESAAKAEATVNRAKTDFHDTLAIITTVFAVCAGLTVLGGAAAILTNKQ